MANNVEWADVDAYTQPFVLGPHDAAGDGNTPAGEENDSTLHGVGVGVGDVVIYGEPQDLRAFFEACVRAVDARIRA
jgi:hypothetical protein